MNLNSILLAVVIALFSYGQYMKIQTDNIIISQLTAINFKLTNLENKVRLANLKLKDMTEIVNVMDRDVADIKVKQ